MFQADEACLLPGRGQRHGGEAADLRQGGELRGCGRGRGPELPDHSALHLQTGGHIQLQRGLQQQCLMSSQR